MDIILLEKLSNPTRKSSQAYQSDRYHITTMSASRVHLRDRMDSQFSFRNNDTARVVDKPDAIQLAVSKEDWYNVSI